MALSDMFSFENTADDMAKQRRGMISNMMASNDNKIPSLPAPSNDGGGWMDYNNTGFFQRLLKNGGGTTIPLR